MKQTIEDIGYASYARCLMLDINKFEDFGCTSNARFLRLDTKNNKGELNDFQVKLNMIVDSVECWVCNWKSYLKVNEIIDSY